MFGHNDNGQVSGQSSAVPEPVEDGMLSAPISDTISAPAVSIPDPSGSTQDGTVQQLLPSAPLPPTDPVAPANATADDLIAIKQHALQELKPLVDHLEQTPEEKFRTTMMMIQAADDQTLIGVAYEAAKAINDEKVRAQALLDVVNEINYFTSQNSQS